jgi:ribosomal-protein-alanine N-acetyltransferase
MADFPRLDTSRLVLREIVESDAAALLAIHGDAEHMKWFGSDPLRDLKEAQRLIEVFASWRQAPSPGTRWGLELREQPGLIGSCGLFGWNKGWKKCVLGYEISPAHAGNGLMKEALARVIAWGFEHMQVNRIEAQVHEENAASIALLVKLGFVTEGRLREVAFWAGMHHDLLQLSLLKAEWPGGDSPVN